MTDVEPTGRQPESKGLVIFDTSALEASCLGPLLRGEASQHILAVRESGYKPAVLAKTLAEVWSHAKLGGGNAAHWAGPASGYPGSIDRMVSLIERATPGIGAQNARQTAWLWFNLAEEWCGSAAALDDVQREFVQWKQSMEAFCRRIEAALEAHGIEIVSAWGHLELVHERRKAASTEREIALHALLPSEDAAWVLDTLIVGARAIVSGDKGVIDRGRYSLGLNLGAPSTVHPTRLRDALDDDFGLAVYPKTG